MLADAAPLTLIGAGKMGGAMLEAWLERGLQAQSVTIVDPGLPAEPRRAYEARGARVLDAVGPAGGEPPRTLVLAVKPQNMDEVLPAAREHAGPRTLVLSIAAGVRLAKLEAAFAPGQPLVRAMPNTPAQIGVGMSVACANAALDAADRELADALLAAIGDVAWIAEEAPMDAVTAVSGSGPAYVFLLTECLAEAGRAAGLSTELAERLARQTVVGSALLMRASGEPAARLRENVTSPGGTTAAALAVLMGEERMARLMAEAVAAAKKRSVELS